MKRLFPAFALLFFCFRVAAQQPTGIQVENVNRIISFLAADNMLGRKIYSPEIEKAAHFIADEFKSAGLKPLTGGDFLQHFSMVEARQESLEAKVGNKELDPQKLVVFTALPELNIKGSELEIRQIKAGDNLFGSVMEMIGAHKNLLVKVDESFQSRFSRIATLKRSFFKTDATVVFVLGEVSARDLTLKATHQINERKLANVAGLLPGKKKKDEYVIFSAHYDHIGTGKPEKGDSIYNGANDDASGTTAVIELARYYSQKGGNERSLIFVAFTAEESGGFGSRYFSGQLAPEKVMAMFNIEMIGTDSKWGKNSAYITGYDRTTMGEILQKNLAGSHFSFHPDPYPEQQLFFRSDNATLAMLGVPAHSISTSKMDNEPNYHRVTDEVKTLDLENMTRIIEAIAVSAKTIVAGKDTPTRVDINQLQNK